MYIYMQLESLRIRIRRIADFSLPDGSMHLIIDTVCLNRLGARTFSYG